MDLSPLLISLKVALCATVVTFFLGLLAGWWVANLRHFTGVIDGIFSLPLVLPPTVIGFFLLLLFGRNGVLGDLFHVVFTWQGACVAAAVVSFPLMYRSARGAFEQLDPTLLQAGRTLGLSEWKLFWRVALPNARPGIIAGAVLSFARAMGEFGATTMLAGNIPGKTQTMALAVYSAVQNGDRATAFRWAIVMMVLSFLVIVLMNRHWKKGGASCR
ncbi:MAG: molybdate ABC transporter permease subunit [Oscillospiraceae bacterium]